MRVLVLERDGATRDWLCGVIRARGHVVTPCGDVREGWEALQTALHPLAILDWAPHAGPSLCRRIRGAPEGWRPFVLASGLSDHPGELEAAVRAGADDYLPKPADAGSLEARLAVAEGQVRQRDERARLVSELERASRALRESEERYARAVGGAQDGLWEWDLATDEIQVSHTWKAMLGFGENEVGGAASEWVGRIHPEDVERVRAKVAAHLAGRTDHFEDEHRMRHKDGTYRWVRCRGFAGRDAEGRPNRMSGTQTDITDGKGYDRLTKLPNRAFFEERLGRTITRGGRGPEARHAVLVLDLDRFKSTNERLGHLAGDELLAAVARRLETCLRPGDLVSRLANDQFALLLEPIAETGDATRIAVRIQERLRAAFTLQGREVLVSASIGIALATPGRDAPEAVLRDAHEAMRRAKASGNGRFEVSDEGRPGPRRAENAAEVWDSAPTSTSRTAPSSR